MPISRIGTDGIENGAVAPTDLSTGGPYWDGSGNVGIGTTSPGGKLAVDPGNNSGTRIDGLHLSKNLTLQANYVAWQQGTVGWRVGIDYNNTNYPLSFLYGSSTPTASSPGTEVARITSDANFQFNSGYGSVATAYGCRAWVNFNGTGTVAIRGSGNVSSITDNGTGDYTVNFTTAMPDANYSAAVTASSSSSLTTAWNGNQTPSTTTYRFNTMFVNNTTGGGSVVDSLYVNFAVFR